MSFLYPALLFALAAIAIPIIIHLFNFRRYKTIYFSNTKFLREIKEKTQSTKQLKHFLILLCRILAIAFLVLTFAQPFFKSHTAQSATGKKAVSIYIDNSFSMGLLDKNVPLFEQAKLKAREIVNAYGDADDFQLLTNDFEGRHQRLVDKAEMLSLINEVQLSPDSRKITDIIARQKQALQNDAQQEKVLYLLSDFQKSTADIGTSIEDSSFQINLVAFDGQQPANVFIDSCWLDAPVQTINQPATLFVKLNNNSDDAVSNGRLTLKLNDQVKAISDFSMDAQQSKTDTLTFNVTDKGWSRVEVSIVDHPISFDDTSYLSFEVSRRINVLMLNEENENRFLLAVFSDTASFNVQSLSYNQVNYSSLPNQQFIVVNGLKQFPSGLAAELKKFLEAGGNVLVVPDSASDISSYNQFFSQANSDRFTGYARTKRDVAEINTQDPLFHNVFENLPRNMALPKSSSGFTFQNITGTNSYSLLKFSDGSTFLSRSQSGKGNLFVVAAAFDNVVSDFPTSPLFAPLIFNMAVLRTSSRPLAYTIGSNNDVNVTANLAQPDQVLKLKSASQEFIPPQHASANAIVISLGQQMREAGFYVLQNEAGEPINWFAMNYDRKESVLSYESNDELKQLAASQHARVIQNADRDLAGIISGQRLGIPLWKVSVIFVLFFLALETILLKLWK